ncbi:hypothetical protein [Thiorhodospira sibirica]|uniref:hypothetical protein n=1 Tax=Thiorhodospira sibirica TaxID=154347 RepID=UPI00022C4662|nr:hypothetical protein [Thiorhodospira sibirica]
MRLSIILPTLVILLFVSLAALASLFDVSLKRQQYLDNLRQEGSAVAVVMAEFLTERGTQALDSRYLPLVRALNSTTVHSIFLPPMTPDDIPRYLLARPPNWDLPDEAQALRTAPGIHIAGLSRSHTDNDAALYFTVFASGTPADAERMPVIVGIVLETTTYRHMLRHAAWQALISISVAALVGLLLAVYLLWMLNKALTRLQLRLQALSQKVSPDNIAPVPRLREFHELDRTICLMDEIERTAIQRQFDELLDANRISNQSALRRARFPAHTLEEGHWEFFMTLVGAASGHFYAHVLQPKTLYIVYGTAASDAQASRAALWWERQLSHIFKPLDHATMQPLYERHRQLFGQHTHVNLLMLSRPALQAGHPYSAKKLTQFLRASLNPAETRLAQNWFTHAPASSALAEIASELDQVLSQQQHYGGVILLARLHSAAQQST